MRHRYMKGRADDYFFAEVHDLLAREARSGVPAAGGWGQPPPSVREQIARRRGLIW